MKKSALAVVLSFVIAGGVIGGLFGSSAQAMGVGGKRGV